MDKHLKLGFTIGDDARVILTDPELQEIERSFAPTAGGINDGCTGNNWGACNNSGCNGSTNTGSCSNGGCTGSFNGGGCQTRPQ